MTSRFHARIAGWRPVLEMVALLLVIAVCLTMLAVVLVPRLLQPAEAITTAPPPRTVREPVPGLSRTPLPTSSISIEDVAIKGTRTAPVAIIAYSDYACPYCARFATTTLRELEKTYLDTGKALFAFKHLPIESIHPQAVRAAEASECAARQGQFWPMHDRLFENPKALDVASLRARADALKARPSCV